MIDGKIFGKKVENFNKETENCLKKLKAIYLFRISDSIYFNFNLFPKNLQYFFVDASCLMFFLFI